MIRIGWMGLLAIVALAGAPAAFGADGKPCGRYGTAVDWYDDEDAARQAAKKTGKLHLAIHISGDFKDPGLT